MTFEKDVSEADFEQAVIAESAKRLVVVDFWAPWCGPCRVLKPLLERLAEEYAGKFLLVKVNADENQNLCMKYAVRGIPSVKAFVNGVVVDEFSGALGEAYVRDFLNRNMPSPADELVAEARRLLAAGDPAQALVKAKEALSIDPENKFAVVEQAAALLEKGDASTAAKLVSGLRGDVLDYERTQRLMARVAIASKVNQLPDEKALLAEIANTEKPSRAKLDLASRYALAERYQEALDLLLEVMVADPNFDDGAARKQMLAIFDLLGNDHELVAKYRRKMASALH